MEPNESKPPKSSLSPSSENCEPSSLDDDSTGAVPDAVDPPGWLDQARPTATTKVAAAAATSFCFAASARRFASSILDGCCSLTETGEQRPVNDV